MIVHTVLAQAAAAGGECASSCATASARGCLRARGFPRAK